MGKIEFLDFSERSTEISTLIKREIHSVGEISDEFVKRVFLVDLDEIGENSGMNQFLKERVGTSYFQNSQAVLILRSESELYTKTYAKKWFFILNQSGCEFPGHALVEMTKDLSNFNTWAKTLQCTKEAAAHNLIKGLIHRLADYGPIKTQKAKVLVLHAGHPGISNTLMLWDQVESQLKEKMGNGLSVQTLHVEEGQIRDCFGCSFETCSYYAMGKSCFYGGFVVESLYPAIEAADYIVWICPNYNDSISAKLMAVINRLTALYRNMNFHDKFIYAVIVSANSGNDAVAGQLIGALSINKGFRVPPKFALMALANAPGEIYESDGIDKKIKNYVNKMLENINMNMV